MEEKHKRQGKKDFCFASAGRLWKLKRDLLLVCLGFVVVGTLFSLFSQVPKSSKHPQEITPTSFPDPEALILNGTLVPSPQEFIN